MSPTGCGRYTLENAYANTDKKRGRFKRHNSRLSWHEKPKNRQWHDRAGVDAPRLSIVAVVAKLELDRQSRPPSTSELVSLLHTFR